MAFLACIVVVISLIVLLSNINNSTPPVSRPRKPHSDKRSAARKSSAANKCAMQTEESNQPVQQSSQTDASAVIEELLTQIKGHKNTVTPDRDDELTTFVISSGKDKSRTTTAGAKKGRWLGAVESVSIHNRKLSKGFIFYGQSLKGLDGYSSEDCLIDPNLPAFLPSNLDNCKEIYSDASLCYWPSYSGLSQQCRGVYLDWLASERTHPNMPIGYIFLYFFGLERRILACKNAIQSIDNQEYLDIFHEIVRLRRIYNGNHSFNNYSGNLLALMIYLRPAVTNHLKNELFQFSNELFFKLILAVTVKNEKPIKASLALDWVRYSDDYYFRTAARRCKEEFQQLFYAKFKEYFADGMLVCPNKTSLKIEYRAANRSSGLHQWNNTDLPDPSILKKPLKDLIAIAEHCTELLGEFSRYLARENSSRDDFAALMLLPDELLNASGFPVLNQFKQWVDTVLNKHNGVTSVQDFWKNIHTDLNKAINKKENELMQRVANRFKLVLVPDSRVQQIKIKPDGLIVLYRAHNGTGFQPSNEFRNTELLLRLGVLVANIDGVVHAKEKELLARFIDSNESLQDAEKQYLHAFLLWCLNNTYGMQGLKDKIEKLDSNQKKIISNLLISIAMADGVIENKEIRQLEKLYTALGLDKSTVASDIHNLSVSTAPPVATQPTTISKQTKPAVDSEISILDTAVLRLHESQTSDVQSLLGSIFSSDNEDDEPQPPPPVPQNQHMLDNAHQQLFDKLITQEHWSRNEYIGLCKELDLLPDGAIETINDWAYERVEAPLIGEDDEIYIDFEIVAELQG